MAKLSPETIKIVCDGIRIGMTVEAAARLGGITKRTLHRWRAADPGTLDAELLAELEEAMDLAMAEGQRVLLERMQKHSAGAKDSKGRPVRDFSEWQATKWILAARHKMGVEQRVDVTSGGQPVKYVVTIPVVGRIDDEPDEGGE
jgi:transposase-like protein